MQLKSYPKPKHPWLQKCLAQLTKIPHIQIDTTTVVEPRPPADALLTIVTPQQINLKYIVFIKSNVTLKTLDIVIEYLTFFQQKEHDDPSPLLVTDTLSDAVIQALIEQNIEFIDTTGNTYLNNSSFYILIKNSAVQSNKLSNSSITTSTLKVAYAILQDPTILKAHSKKLEEVAGVDLKTAKRSLQSLCKLNYLQRQKGNQYRIENYLKLIERWNMGYVENLRSELLIDTFSPILYHQFSEISNEIIDLAKTDKFLIGGELGAALITNYLKPISAVIHIPKEQNYRLITTKLRLRPDPQGNISILKQFGSKNTLDNNYPNFVVDPLLIYAELALHPDERLKETANRLYHQYISDKQEIALDAVA